MPHQMAKRDETILVNSGWVFLLFLFFFLYMYTDFRIVWTNDGGYDGGRSHYYVNNDGRKPASRAKAKKSQGRGTRGIIIPGSCLLAFYHIHFFLWMDR